MLIDLIQRSCLFFIQNIIYSHHKENIPYIIYYNKMESTVNSDSIST